MAETKRPQLPKKKTGHKAAAAQPESQAEPLAADVKRQLEQLDEFIGQVLEEAGEEFLEEFRQIEGE